MIDAWLERYLVVVPERLSATDARILIDLIEEDTERFVRALVALADTDEELDGAICA